MEYKGPDGKMVSFTNQTPHYVVENSDANHNSYLYVFDWENLMRWVLCNITAKDINVYYCDKLTRTAFSKDKEIIAEGYHLQDPNELIKQALKYEADMSIMKTETISMFDLTEYGDIPTHKWRDCFRRLPVDDSCRDGLGRIIYPRKHTKSHSVSAFRIPRNVWKRIRFENRLRDIIDEYDEDYSSYMTKKNRHTSCKMGWWDDYARARRSTGWKESTKQKYQNKFRRQKEREEYICDSEIEELLLAPAYAD